jgi:hypothetical protein
MRNLDSALKDYNSGNGVGVSFFCCVVYPVLFLSYSRGGRVEVAPFTSLLGVLPCIPPFLSVGLASCINDLLVDRYGGMVMR